MQSRIGRHLLLLAVTDPLALAAAAADKSNTEQPDCDGARTRAAATCCFAQRLVPVGSQAHRSAAPEAQTYVRYGVPAGVTLTARWWMTALLPAQSSRHGELIGPASS